MFYKHFEADTFLSLYFKSRHRKVSHLQVHSPNARAEPGQSQEHRSIQVSQLGGRDLIPESSHAASRGRTGRKGDQEAELQLDPRHPDMEEDKLSGTLTLHQTPTPQVISISKDTAVSLDLRGFQNPHSPDRKHPWKGLK